MDKEFVRKHALELCNCALCACLSTSFFNFLKYLVN